MRKTILLLSAMLLIQAADVSMFAQSKPKAGDKISGIVSDSIGPMWKVKVVEKDAMNKTVRKCVTNKNGEFSFRLVNPDDRIQVTYELYDTVNLPIDTTRFDIKIIIQDELLTPIYIDGPYSGFEGVGRLKYEYVDLGLSVKWATCNVGADKPEDYGDYYAWGETKHKIVYNGKTYKWCKGLHNTLIKYCNNSEYGNKGFIDNKTTLDLEDDVAHVKWSGSWRMPTLEELNELCNNCTWQWYSSGNTEFNGVAGYKVISNKEGFTNRFIFLPTAGCRDGARLRGCGNHGLYWSNSLTFNPFVAMAVYISSDRIFTDSYNRDDGFPIRPVCQ